MKTSLMFVAALALGSVGCKKKGGAGNDCAPAIANSMAVSKADMEKMPGMDAAMMKKMADVGVLRCTEDKWSVAVIKCMVDAKTKADAQGCYGKLTGEQQTKMNKAARELAIGPHEGGSAAAGSADPTMGSAAGSAEGSAGSAGSAAGSAAAGSSDTGSGSAAPK